MKFRPNKHYVSIAICAFFVIAAAILFYEAITNLSVIFSAGRAVMQFIQPIIYGFVFAFLLNPMLRMYDDRLLPRLTKGKLRPRARRAVSLVLTYITMIFIITLFFRLVIPQLVLSLESLFLIVPKYIESLNNLYLDLTKALADYQILNEGTELATLLRNITNKLTDSLEGVIENAYEYVTGLLPQIFSAGAKLTTGIVNFFLGIIISIYFLYDREKLFAQAKKIGHALFSQRTNSLLYDICMDANRVFSGFITGKIIDSAIIGVICFVGMSLMRMPYAVLISVIIGVTNIIPYFGPFIGAIPSILIIVLYDPWKALLFLIFILVLQQFDGNVLGPKILGDTTGLSALWVIFAIMLFSGIFGVLGMFIGVPLFAMIYILVKRAVAFLLHRKGEPVDTKDYASEKNPLL